MSPTGAEEVLIKEIRKALEFKQAVIEQDEFDRGYRNIMNFGHTFGHALEATSDYVVPHGQAVAIGILIADEISVQRGLMGDGYREQIAEAIHRIVSLELLHPEYFSNGYLDALKKDKKYTGKSHACILASEQGVKKYTDVTDEEVMAGLDSFLQSIKRG